PLVIGDLVIAGCDDRDPGGVGHLYGFDGRTGRVRWRQRLGRGGMSDLVHRGSLVYAMTLDDGLRCIEAATGRPLWSQRSRAVFDTSASTGVQSTPALVGERIVCGGQDSVVAALDAARGTRLWQRSVGARVQSAIVDSGRSVYLAARDGRLLRLDAGDGRTLGERRVGRTFGPPLVTPDGVLMLVLEDSGEDEPPLVLRCFDARLETVLWTYRCPGGVTSSRPYVWRGTILGGGGDGLLFALRSSDGAVLW